MDALELVDDFVASHPLDPDATVMARLVNALRDGASFDVQDLYELRVNSFELAMSLLADWRLQRYYRGNAVPAAAVALGH